MNESQLLQLIRLLHQNLWYQFFTHQLFCQYLFISCLNIIDCLTASDQLFIHQQSAVHCLIDCCLHQFHSQTDFFILFLKLSDFSSFSERLNLDSSTLSSRLHWLWTSLSSRNHCLSEADNYSVSLNSSIKSKYHNIVAYQI